MKYRKMKKIKVSCRIYYEKKNDATLTLGKQENEYSLLELRQRFRNVVVLVSDTF